MIVPSLSLSAHTREGFRVFRLPFGLFMLQFLCCVPIHFCGLSSYSLSTSYSLNCFSNQFIVIKALLVQFS